VRNTLLGKSESLSIENESNRNTKSKVKETSRGRRKTQMNSHLCGDASDVVIGEVNERGALDWRIHTLRSDRLLEGQRKTRNHRKHGKRKPKI
jgi:hypothetical protein